MSTPSAIHIVDAEMVDGGVAVTFSDGTSGLFLAAFLYDHLSEATKLENGLPDPPE